MNNGYDLEMKNYNQHFSRKISRENQETFFKDFDFDCEVMMN